jgi:hypothetical protein
MAKDGGSCGISGVVGFGVVKDGGCCGFSGTIGGGNKISGVDGGGESENEYGSCGVINLGTSGGEV